MFLLKSNYDKEINELFDIKEQMKELKKKEDVIKDTLKNYMLEKNLAEILTKKSNIVVKLVKKTNTTICPADLYKKTDHDSFINLVKVDITKTKKFLSEKDLKEISLSDISYSLTIKKG